MVYLLMLRKYHHKGMVGYLLIKWELLTWNKRMTWHSSRCEGGRHKVSQWWQLLLRESLAFSAGSMRRISSRGSFIQKHSCNKVSSQRCCGPPGCDGLILAGSTEVTNPLKLLSARLNYLQVQPPPEEILLVCLSYARTTFKALAFALKSCYLVLLGMQVIDIYTPIRKLMLQEQSSMNCAYKTRTTPHYLKG